MKCLYKGNRRRRAVERGMRFKDVTNESTRTSLKNPWGPYRKSIPAARATIPATPPAALVLTAPDFFVSDALAAELEPVEEPDPPPAAVALTAAEPVSGLAFEEKGLVWLLLVST